MAFYPMKGQFYLDKEAVPIIFVGQEQVGNASTNHLGWFDYMAAVSVTPEQGDVLFNFKHLGVLMELSVNIPRPS